MSDHRPVSIIVDSTCDLPSDLAQEMGLIVVPLSVHFGEETFRDGIDISPEAFIERLRSAESLPTTSQPSVPAFEDVFRKEIDQGHDVVCLTISSELSGTYNSARLAAESVDAERIHIIDTGALTIQLGLIAIAAARAAQAGQSHTEVVAEATRATENSRFYAVLQTLDYAYKGGRIGRAQHMVGSALAIKPILTLVDGLVTPVERIRTWKKAISRAEQLIGEVQNASDVFVAHMDNQADADRIASELKSALPDATIRVGWAGPVIGTYAGPGAIGIAALPR